MLNRQRVAQKLNVIHKKIFYDTSMQEQTAKESWQRIVEKKITSEIFKKYSCPWSIPEWKQLFNTSYFIEPFTDPYTLVATDGSQIYPDRHEGLSCFLINIGVAQTTYGQHCSVRFSSEPTVFSGIYGDESLASDTIQDLINCLRQELEFQEAVQSAINVTLKNNHSVLVLCDGSLIFWHLVSKGKALQEKFIHAYLLQLESLYEKKILNAGYISLPKSKELVHMLRFEIAQFSAARALQEKKLTHIFDTVVAQFYLEKYHRTQIFKSTVAIAQKYPDHLKPYFFYLDVGVEVVRIEIPAWIAKEKKLVDQVAAIALDQSIKGNGYPVMLAEAHEQAVVKAVDRNFFYNLLSKIGIEKKKIRQLSQKNMKKNNMSI